ncbi:MAG: MBL fold metallo-hydrolase [Ignavibacteriae bacterium]|nr:MBL fold metallo-hydrolase [Ignavibacteriota bacterium]
MSGHNKFKTLLFLLIFISWDLIKFLLFTEKGDWDDWWNEKPGPKPEERVFGDSVVVTFVNHATFLIQTNGINILTDPIWSELASPVAFVGMERHRPPGIRFDDLPPIDIVLISHNHYDHLDIPTLKRLKEKFNPVFIVPLGNKELMLDDGLSNTIELDWWQEYFFKNKYKLTLVPARHFSMRGLTDRNISLWGAYIINTEIGPIYFAGDTGFGIHFKQIYDKFGQIRLAFLPIGPIEPRWFFGDVHLSANEAVEAHKILKAKTSIAIHWGTFSQGADDMLDAPREIKKLREKELKDPGEFIVPIHGRKIVIK